MKRLVDEQSQLQALTNWPSCPCSLQINCNLGLIFSSWLEWWVDDAGDYWRINHILWISCILPAVITVFWL